MDSETNQLVAHLFRHQSAMIVAKLARVFGARHLDLAEDVVQDALIKALQQWPFKGIPENPAGWLTLVARNRALDLLRRDASLANKIADLEKIAVPETGSAPMTEMDDQLALILMCSHPAFTIESRVALTLKTACGFSTAEIARAFLTPETTIAQRLVRAKRQIREHGIVIDPPSEEDLPERLDSVLRVIYLLFNEGYSATGGDDLVRTDLCEEAIRLANLLLQHKQLQTPVVHALLALMLLQAARLPARTDIDGSFVLFLNQDRSLWDQRLIAAGLRHLGASADGDKLTGYHLQAEIAAIHATAASDGEIKCQSDATGHRQEPWVDKYGTGSGSDRVEPITRITTGGPQESWVDKYGTGSDSDRVEPTSKKTTERPQEPWVDKYGTGSGPGSLAGQPGWGGGSDRVEPTSKTATEPPQEPWVDKYGTGSGPGSLAGQPGWGGGSDRVGLPSHPGTAFPTAGIGQDGRTSTNDGTNWEKITDLYRQLYELEPTPIVALNGAIARARWQGPEAGLRALDEISSHPALRNYHLLPAVRAELLKQLGDYPAATEAYKAALQCPCTAPERRFLESQLASLIIRG